MAGRGGRAGRTSAATGARSRPSDQCEAAADEAAAGAVLAADAGFKSGPAFKVKPVAFSQPTSSFWTSALPVNGGGPGGCPGDAASSRCHHFPNSVGCRWKLARELSPWMFIAMPSGVFPEGGNTSSAILSTLTVLDGAAGALAGADPLAAGALVDAAGGARDG